MLHKILFLENDLKAANVTDSDIEQLERDFLTLQKENSLLNSSVEKLKDQNAKQIGKVLEYENTTNKIVKEVKLKITGKNFYFILFYFRMENLAKKLKNSLKKLKEQRLFWMRQKVI